MEAKDFMSRGRISTQNLGTDSHSSGRNHRGPRGAMKVVMLGMVLSIALLISAVMAFVFFGGNTSEEELIKSDQYQAVFLNDQSGQVYFGKLSTVNSKFYRLKDVFYLSVDQLQPDGEESTLSSTPAKLVNMLHGPENEMFIARDKVLFWENQRDDGEVVKAIVKYKADGIFIPAADTSETTIP